MDERLISINLLCSGMMTIYLLYFYTPRQRRDWFNSFGMICPSVCVCVCLALTGERTDIRT